MVSEEAPRESGAGAAQAGYGGVVVPMVTPFTEDGQVDEPAVRRLVDHLVRGGIGGILLLGTTGEAASMEARERLRLVETAVAHIARRVRVFAGISDDSLAAAAATAKAYRELGVDAFLAHVPSYYPLGAAEVHAWFERLADRVPAPLFLYNIPMTTHVSIPEDVVEALSRHANIAGIKDSEYDAARMERLLARFRGRPDFAYFVGPSVMAKRGLELGADGIVPGVGNLLPRTSQRLFEAARAGDHAAAGEAQQRLKRIGDTYQAGRSVTHAIALLKAALAALGLCRPVVLPPLLPPPEAEARAAAAAARELAAAEQAEDAPAGV